MIRSGWVKDRATKTWHWLSRFAWGHYDCSIWPDTSVKYGRSTPGKGRVCKKCLKKHPLKKEGR